MLPESIVIKDALDSSELTRLDLKDLERKYGFPYMVILRSDLHSIFLRACRRAGVELPPGPTKTWSMFARRREGHRASWMAVQPGGSVASTAAVAVSPSAPFSNISARRASLSAFSLARRASSRANSPPSALLPCLR